MLGNNCERDASIGPIYRHFILSKALSMNTVKQFYIEEVSVTTWSFPSCSKKSKTKNKQTDKQKLSFDFGAPITETLYIEILENLEGQINLMLENIFKC